MDILDRVFALHPELEKEINDKVEERMKKLGWISTEVDIDTVEIQVDPLLNNMAEVMGTSLDPVG